jgi:hypothetical protein
MNVHLAVLGVDGVRNKAGKSFMDKGITCKEGEVPVWLEARELRDRDLSHIIGSAKLSVHDGVLWADCKLLDFRLPASLVRILYPHPCGTVLKTEGDVVQEMYVDGVNFSSDEPLDTRIATLVVQGVKATMKG